MRNLKLFFLVSVMLIGIGNAWAETKTLKADFTKSNSEAGTSPDLFAATGGATGSYYGLKPGSSITSKSPYNVDPTQNISVKMKVGTYGGFDATNSNVDFYIVDKNGKQVSSTFTSGLTGTNTNGTEYSGSVKLNIGELGENVYFKFVPKGGTNSIYPRFFTLEITYTIASLTPKQTFPVLWLVNGEEYSVGNPTLSVEEGAKVSQLPTAPQVPEGCAGKVFVGWTDKPIEGDTDDKPDILFASADDSPEIYKTTTFYAVFATQSNTGGSTTTTKWIKTDLADVKEGIYALITPDGKAFNGTITSGHGQTTSESFSFDGDGCANTAPNGICELTLTSSGSGFKMYNANNGYLYATKATSGGLSWNSTENNYWSYSNSNWIYSSNSAYLRTYSNSSFRTYATNTNDVLYFVKKETIVSNTYSNYTTSCSSGDCNSKVTLNVSVSGNGGQVSWNGTDYSTTLENKELNTCNTTNTTYLYVQPDENYTIDEIKDNGSDLQPTATGSNIYLLSYEQNATGDHTIEVTFKEKATYTLTYYINTDPTEIQNVYEGTNILSLLPETAEPCDLTSTTFMGWTTQELTEKQPDTPPTIGHDDVIDDNITLYALFAKVDGEEGWVLTDIEDLKVNDVFVFSDGTYAFTNDNGTSNAPATSSITTTNNRIISEVAENIQWTLSGNTNEGYTFYPNGSTTTWLYCNTTAESGTNNNIRVGTGNRKLFVLDNEGVLMTNDNNVARYLCVYNNQDLRGYVNKSNGTPLKPKLYRKSTGSITDFITTCKCPELAAPTGLTEDNITSSSATLSWNAVTNAASYKVLIMKLEDDNEGKTYRTEETHITISDLEPETNYLWTVKAIAENENCTSGESEIGDFTTEVFSCKPATPEGFTYVRNDDWSYTLSWEAVAGEDIRYNIRSTPSGFYTTVSGTSSTTNALKDNTEYTIYLTAVATVDGYEDCVSEEAVLTLKTEKYVTVTFDPGNGTSETLQEQGGAIELPDAQTSCDGWEFAGWTDVAITDITETHPTTLYRAGTPYYPQPGSDITLYAVYTMTEGEVSAAWNLVTDVNTLQAGKKVLIVNESANKAMGTQGNNNRSATTVSISNHTITTITADVRPLTLGTSNGYWTLFDEQEVDNKGYLYAAGTGNNNYLKSQATIDDKARWTITIASNGDATIKAITTVTERNLIRYNGNNTLFSCYNSGQSDVQLYILTDGQVTSYTTYPDCRQCEESGAEFAQDKVRFKNATGEFDSPRVIYNAGKENLSPRTYSSTNTKVATVNSDGKVTVHALGSTYITLTQPRYVTDTDYDICAVEISYLLQVGPDIDIVEWQEDGVILHVDKDDNVNPQLIVSGEQESGDIEAEATDIFFSKYFEAEGNTKLLAIYNGTKEPISLTDITIWHRGNDNINLSEKMATSDYYKDRSDVIYPREELIFYNRGSGDTDYSACAEDQEGFEKWIDCNNASALAFGGKGTITLKRGNEIIDIIGAYNKEGKPVDASTKPSFGDKEGFVCTDGTNYLTGEDGYELSTNRCLLIRKNSVTDGTNAVQQNSNGEFVTLCQEWQGLQIKTVGEKGAATCEGFASVGGFDYSDYYKELVQIAGSDLSGYIYNEDEDLYKFPVTVSDYACLNMEFQLVNPDDEKEKDIWAQETVKVPILVSGEASTTDPLFTNIVDGHPDLSIDRCSECDVVVLENASLTLNSTSDNETNVTQLRGIKVYQGGELIVEQGASHRLRNIAFRRKDDQVASAQLNGNPELTWKLPLPYSLDLYVSAQKWHFITLPYDCRVEDVTYADGTKAKFGTEWFAMSYDGAKRVENKAQQTCWTEITGSDFTLEAGVGYIVGILGYDNQQARQELRFPMDAKLALAEQENKYVPVYAYGAGQDITPNHKGWNLVGNPYLYNYCESEPGAFGGLAVGKLIQSDNNTRDWVLDDSQIPYIAIPINNGDAGYRQLAVTDTVLPPFTCYFVQAGTDQHSDGGEFYIEFKADNKVAADAASVLRRAPEEYTDTYSPVLVTVSLANSQAETDRTSLVVSDRFLPSYEMGADLVKWFGDNYRAYSRPVLWSLASDGQRAFNALSEEAALQAVPLGIYAAAQGDYTFSLVRTEALGRVADVWLHDALTGTYTNLMEQDYTFNTAPADGTGRFSLSVRLVPQTATAVDNALSGCTITSGQGTLTVNNLPPHASLWLYDTSGRLLYAESVNHVQRTYEVPQAGVYYVRIESANNEQILRTIVK